MTLYIDQVANLPVSAFCIDYSIPEPSAIEWNDKLKKPFVRVSVQPWELEC